MFTRIAWPLTALTLCACVDGPATIIDMVGGAGGTSSGPGGDATTGGMGGQPVGPGGAAGMGGGGGSSPCGNGVIDPGEACDDGHADDLLCNASCEIVCTGTQRSDGHCYVELAIGGLDWDDAATACDAIAAHLPVLETAAEVAYLDGEFGTAGGFEVWSAARDIGMVVDGEFRWSTPDWPMDDTVVPSDVFLSTQPNSEGASDCCYLILTNGNNGLNDHLCNASYPSVLCERPPPEGL